MDQSMEFCAVLSRPCQVLSSGRIRTVLGAFQVLSAGRGLLLPTRMKRSLIRNTNAMKNSSNWGSDQFDPNAINKPAIAQALKALAKNGPENTLQDVKPIAVVFAGWLR